MENKLTSSDYIFAVDCLNECWYNANTKLQRKDLGDLDRKFTEQRLNRAKELMEKFKKKTDDIDYGRQ